MKRIVHATDLLPDGGIAFEHAVALARDAGAELATLYANPSMGQTDRALPSATALLQRWDEADSAVAHHRRTHEPLADPVDSLLDAFISIRPDLLIVGTRQPTGDKAPVRASVAATIARKVTVPTLLIPIGERGFVDPATGKLSLDPVVVPVGDTAAANCALTTLAGLLESLRVAHVEVHLLSVNGAVTRESLDLAANDRMTMVFAERQGPLEETINQYADDTRAGLIVMATRQQDSTAHSALGTRTEQVVLHAGCPVLSIPISPIPE